MNCEKCGTDRKPIHTHRIIPGRLGGRYVDGNVMRLCNSCHTKADAETRLLEGYKRMKHEKFTPPPRKERRFDPPVARHCMFCDYSWESRTAKPVACPSCKRYHWEKKEEK